MKIGIEVRASARGGALNGLSARIGEEGGGRRGFGKSEGETFSQNMARIRARKLRRIFEAVHELIRNTAIKGR